MQCEASENIWFAFIWKATQTSGKEFFHRNFLFILYDVASSSGELKKPSIDDHFEQKQQDETTPVELVPQGN